MTKAAVVVLTLCIGGAAGWFLNTSRSATWSTESRPTIEQIQQLASLVVLHVPIADVQVYQLEGYTGGIRAAMVIKGDIEIATDLTAAQLKAVDIQHRQAVLVLPAPTATRPRLDHEKTRIYRIDRSGLWQVVPGETGEQDLMNRALQDAQRMVGDVGSQSELIAQAQSRTQEVVTNFFRALGWQVEIHWLDQQVSVHAASSAVSAG